MGEYTKGHVSIHLKQNGIAKKKHRHVLEMARAIRFQRGIPLNSWGYCVLAATNIINRLPTVSLQENVHMKYFTTSNPVGITSGL